MGSKFFASKLLVTCHTPASVGEQTDSLRVDRGPRHRAGAKVAVKGAAIFFCSPAAQCISVFIPCLFLFPILHVDVPWFSIVGAKVPWSVIGCSEDTTCLYKEPRWRISGGSRHFLIVLIFKYLRSRMGDF